MIQFATPEGIAIALMRAIIYDAGWVNCYEPENIEEYWVERIAVVVKPIFEANPKLLTEYHIEEIAYGDEEEFAEHYGHIEGMNQLNDLLENYFACGGEWDS